MLDREEEQRGERMLIPPPEADLNESSLVRGADILDFLKKREGKVVVEEIMLHFLKQHPKSNAENFMDTISLLFALDLIEYESFRIGRKQP